MHYYLSKMIFDLQQEVDGNTDKQGEAGKQKK